MATTSFLLKVADDTVLLFQRLITILSDYYEASLRDMSSHSGGYSLVWPNLASVQLACHELSENLATLWPCEKHFVAVFGRTGCGKSTLLNLLLSMMCTTAERYKQGIKSDSSRAVLRDTARIHGEIARGSTTRGQLNSAPSEDLEDAESCKQSIETLSETKVGEDVKTQVLVNERLSICGILGICCARDRQSYMREHIPQYDNSPFILQNGRMGDAGTIKVTAIEFGPKFVGRVRWISRKKLRKKLRDLRHLMGKAEGSQCSLDDERNLEELKEFWYCVRTLTEIPSHVAQPSEQQITRVIDILVKKQRVLDREDVIETVSTKGCNIDRIFVREGIKERLNQQLGKLVEDLRIEVPVPSFEGGIGLLDVPGTNDPRVLHQRETRDAIDRTSLILLVLDKSVMDLPTQNSLVDSPLLERMLMDETVQCSLVVVGIAEKDCKKGQSAQELLNGFDPKEDILKTLKKIFLKIASSLCKSKRIQKSDALERVESLFASSIFLIPVLPFLCASIYLSSSNPDLHKVYCESENHTNCPVSMSKEELQDKCIETNIPQLLEKLHSVRMPPKSEELCHCIKSTRNCLNSLTQEYELNISYAKFMEREWDQAKSITADNICLEFPDSYVDDILIDSILDKCAEECILNLDEMKDIIGSVREEKLSELQTGRFSLGPSMIRGFKPEVVGQRAQQLIQSVDSSSQVLVDLALKHLNFLRGDDARIEATVDEVDAEYQPLAVGLYDQLHNRWELSLRRLRAKCFCGGIDGGLLGHSRMALRKAYYGSLKFLLKKIKEHSNSQGFKQTLYRVLESNELGLHAAKIAKIEFKKAIEEFWQNLLELTNKEMKFLWKAWQEDIRNLAESALNALSNHKVTENMHSKMDVDSSHGRLKLFQGMLKDKLQELDSLLKLLIEPVDTTRRDFHYGYSLLQFDPQFCSDLTDAAAQTSITVGRGKNNLADSLNPERVESGAPASVHTCLESATSKRDQLSNYQQVHGRLSNDQQMGEGECRQRKDGDLTAGEANLARVKNDRYNIQCGSSGDGLLLMGNDLSSPRSPNLMKLGSFSKQRRKAQVLSEAESHRLQSRERDSKRPRK